MKKAFRLKKKAFNMIMKYNGGKNFLEVNMIKGENGEFLGFFDFAEI